MKSSRVNIEEEDFHEIRSSVEVLIKKGVKRDSGHLIAL